MKGEFRNKKILFFSPKFFNYEREIKKKLESLGAEVDYFDERVDNKSITKIAIRLSRGVITQKINEYYQNILKQSSSKKYDYVFFICPETITPELLKKLKGLQQSAVFIIYMWDSLKNKKNTKAILSFFDKHFSFDMGDCQTDKRFKFRPLFYLDDYSYNVENKSEYKYDLGFVGTIHSDRYSIMRLLAEQASSLNLKSHFFMYFPSKILYYAKKIFDSSYREAKINFFNFTPLSKAESIDIIANSKIVIDIQHPNQHGLTMRTLEMLGMEKKLITTNTEVTKYDFYDSRNICVIDRKNPVLNVDFCKTAYCKIEENIYRRYSIQSWLEEIFN